MPAFGWVFASFLRYRGLRYSCRHYGASAGKARRTAFVCSRHPSHRPCLGQHVRHPCRGLAGDAAGRRPRQLSRHGPSDGHPTVDPEPHRGLCHRLDVRTHGSPPPGLAHGTHHLVGARWRANPPHVVGSDSLHLHLGHRGADAALSPDQMAALLRTRRDQAPTGDERAGNQRRSHDPARRKASSPTGHGPVDGTPALCRAIWQTTTSTSTRCA